MRDLVPHRGDVLIVLLKCVHRLYRSTVHVMGRFFVQFDYRSAISFSEIYAAISFISSRLVDKKRTSRMT